MNLKISKDIYDPLMDTVREATNAGIKIRFRSNFIFDSSNLFL